MKKRTRKTPKSTTDVNIPVPECSAQGSRAPSERAALTISSRSSATIRAQKAAVEALALRRRLEREQELVDRERERERELAALRQQVEESELQAELAAIDADVSGSHAGSRISRHSSRLSVDRTQKWVQDQFTTEINKGTFAVGCVQNLSVPSPSRLVLPATVARSTAPCINPLTHHHNGNKVSEAVGITTPLVPAELNNHLLKAVADTAAAAKALACAPNVKKLELFPFSGNVLQWLQFKRIYDVTKDNFSPLENMNRLQNAVRGAAREAVAALLMSAEDPEEVVRALEDNFARPELIVHKEVTCLKNLPRLGNDLKELGTLSNRVRNSISCIRLLKQVEYLYSPELFHAVLSKLNPTIKMRWTDFAMQDATGRSKLEILSDFLKRELDQHIRFGLSPESSPTQLTQYFSNDKQHKRENINTVMHSKTGLKDSSSTKHECSFCRKDHNIKSCSEFQSLAIDDRWQWLREAKVCYRCLRRSSHQWKTCKVNPCGIDGCLIRHHPLLHKKPLASLINTFDTQTLDRCPVVSEHNNTVTNISEPTDEKVIVSTTSTGVEQVNTILALRPRAYLKIVPVTVSGPSGTCDVYALLDDGSTATLIDSSIASLIGATGPQQSITVNGIGGLERNTTVSYVNFHIKGRHTQETFLVKNARAMHSLSLRPQTIRPDSINCFSHLTDLVDVLVHEDATPTILIGAEHWHLSINRDVRAGRRNEPVACLTALGWTLYGVASSKTKLVEFVNHVAFTEASSNENLDLLIKEQYKIDSIGISRQETLHNKREQQAINILEATSRRLPSGRFEVGMPWRDDIQRVPDSYAQAMSRFLSLERRMAKDNVFAKAYEGFMSNMIDKGYAEECGSETYYANRTSEQMNSNIRLYLPHFGVYHPQKRKIRVVHDAAAKNDGVSLNSLLLSGPDLLQPLLKVLFRFREGCIALTADIREMFPQIRIRVQDRDALRYLWRSDKLQPIKEFRMTAVIFGACCSPFIAQFIKNKNANEHMSTYPKAVDAILFNHYMDDYIDSLDSVSEAAQLATDIVTVHKSACFEMRGWISNESAALNLVPEELQAAQPSEIELATALNTTRALGIAWDPTSDNLGFRTGLSETVPCSLTKRKVLSHLMRVYDPLGLLGPIVIKGRILFQQAWRLNIDWDSELPSTEASKWSGWFQELLTAATVLKIPRWYSKAKNAEPSYKELHILADASELAYACVAYWRSIYADGSIELTLISSKARVSPLKPISIPRLELQAALIASRLALTIKDSHRKKPVRTFFWTDSMTVLQWLRSDARAFKPFVAHRLGEIMENSSIKDWRWVPTDLNVADDATRMHPVKLDLNHRWFMGPSFLLRPPEDWPIEAPSVAPSREERKSLPSELVGLTSVSLALPCPVVANFAQFSSWLRLLRATARTHQVVTMFGNVLVALRNSKSNGGISRSRHPTTSTTLKPLNAELMKAAERHILQKTQLDSFPEEYSCILNSKPVTSSSRLIKLSPTLGEDKLLHLAGRIKAAEGIDPDSRFPILLDGRHPVVKLLVESYHRQAGHANHELVINEIRQRFWLLKLRDTVRAVANRCLFCRLRKSVPFNPVTGDLPPQRLSHHQRPFSYTGIDYFGPITITVGRRHEKRYVALLTCLTTRAVHLEIVHSLSADSAIMAIRRFIARRGKPETMFSDNGTAFVGANRILKEFHTTDVHEFIATKGIKWSFIPAAAPSFGGCWERLVRTVKVALKSTLNERAPKEETLMTLLAEAEAIVNSRPLTHVSTDPEDPTTLTPFHFLIGTSSNQNLPKALNDRDLILRVEWKKALRLSDHFWNRWVREVLPTMQPRTQNKQENDHLKIGDVVIIVDESLPRGTWPRGRVMQLYPGKDGVTRVVDVATAGGTLRRPLKKLVKLVTEIANDRL